jgi:hypothetical protein
MVLFVAVRMATIWISTAWGMVRLGCQMVLEIFNHCSSVSRMEVGLTTAKEIVDLDRKRIKEWRDNIQCPVCGYYCLGNGGFGCIDKPFFQKPIAPEERAKSLKVCRSIGRKIGAQTYYDESLNGGT